MKRTIGLGLVLVLLGSVFAFAGEQPGTPPKYVVLTREDIKVGKMGAHDELARQVRQTATTTNSSFRWIAGSPVAGNTSEFVVMSGYDSYADIEKGFKEFSNLVRANLVRAEFTREAVESHNKLQTIIARYREDLSYRPETIDPAKARYWQITIVQVRPGTASQIEDNHKQVAAAMKQHNADVHWATYQVQYGLGGPAFIRFSALQSLADLDVDRSAVMQKVWSPTLRSVIDSSSRESVVRSETLLLGVRPEVSRPSESMLAANPEFWTVSEQPAVAEREQRRPVRPAAQRDEQRPR